MFGFIFNVRLRMPATGFRNVSIDSISCEYYGRRGGFGLLSRSILIRRRFAQKWPRRFIHPPTAWNVSA